LTYDMKVVRGAERFSANFAMMDYLLAAILESGVNLLRHRVRPFGPEEDREPMEGNLLDCFASNDGWLVTPEEAMEIAEKVGAALPGWIAAPKVVDLEDLMMLEVPGEKEGEPSRWVAVERIDLVRGVRGREAAEIGANEKVAERVRLFIAFCRKAGTSGGFCVY